MKDIHDIISPVPVGINPLFIKAAMAGLVLIAGLLLIYFLFRLFKKRRDKRQDDMLLLPAPLPPDQAAIKDLESFLDLMETDSRLFYFRLTGVVKTFIGKCFKINASEMTTQELVMGLRYLDIEKKSLSDLRDFFISSDGIKYAGKYPDMDMMKKDETFVRAFVAIVSAGFLSDKAAAGAVISKSAAGRTVHDTTVVSRSAADETAHDKRDFSNININKIALNKITDEKKGVDI